MPAQLVELEGIANWAKVFEFNRDTAARATHPGVKEKLEETDGQYSIDLVMDKENVDKLSKAGSRLKPNIVEEGISFKLKRPHRHPAGIADFGGPPKVVDEDQNPWDDRLIGNGSKVRVYVSVYDTKMGKGTRLEAVQVLELEEVPEREDEGGGVRLPF